MELPVGVYDLDKSKIECRYTMNGVGGDGEVNDLFIADVLLGGNVSITLDGYTIYDNQYHYAT